MNSLRARFPAAADRALYVYGDTGLVDRSAARRAYSNAAHLGLDGPAQAGLDLAHRSVDAASTEA